MVLEEKLEELRWLSKEVFGQDLSELPYDTLYVADSTYRKGGKVYGYFYVFGEKDKKKKRIAKLRYVDDKIRKVIALYRSAKLIQKALEIENLVEA